MFSVIVMLGFVLELSFQLGLRVFFGFRVKIWVIIKVGSGFGAGVAVWLVFCFD